MSRYPYDIECEYAGYLGTGGMRQLGIDQAQQESDRCDDLVEELAQKERDEYEAEFSAEYKAKHPLRLDYLRLREQVLQRLRKENL